MKQAPWNIRIIGTGSYAPKNILSNADLENMVDTSDEWIKSRTGIEQRHIVDDEDTSDLATKAAQNAFEKYAIDPSTIDLIIVATFTPDLLSPSVASLVQEKLKLTQAKVTSFDLNAACTGFIYACEVASALIHGGAHTRALVIGAEVISKAVDFNDRDTCVLFGDGAGAIILEKGTENDQAWFYTNAKADPELLIKVEEKIEMDGKKVYQFASRVIVEGLETLLAKTDLSMDDIGVIIPHQANIRIIQAAAKQLHLPQERFFTNIEKYGNTSAASIGIALDEYRDAHHDTRPFMMVGFGSGLTWGSALFATKGDAR